VLRRIALVTAVPLTLGTLTLLVGAADSVAAPPGYKANTALINGDTITTNAGITEAGKPISLEEYAAHKAGFKTTVVTGAQWIAMSASDFAKYQLLIIGDPNCSVIPTSATSTSSVWSKAVMGTSGVNPTVGNRALIGTDPEFHYVNGGGNAQPTDPSNPSTAGAEQLVQAGIMFAGGVAGATGAYFDTSCGDNGQIQSTLNRLSSRATGFTLDTSPPCGGRVAQIATTPAFSGVQDSDVVDWGCSVHISFPTYPTDWQPLIVATDTATHPTCGTDPGTGTRECGEAYVLVAGRGIVATAPDLKLAPAHDTSPSGSTHTVTATVTKSGKPAAGVKVSFDVTGLNAGATGTCAPTSCVTGADGTVRFTYRDTHGIGDDTISATATIDGSNERATATESWIKAVNHPPTANDQSVTTPLNTPKDITLTASDPDGNTLTYKIITQPEHGTLSGTGKNVIYTPDAGYSGPDSFMFTVSDGQLTSDPAAVNITVEPAAPPLANTGVETGTQLAIGLGLLALGLMLIGFGRVRVPRREAR
jgi:hypothetical protein